MRTQTQLLMIIVALFVSESALGQVELTYKGRIYSVTSVPGALAKYSTFTVQLDGDPAPEIITKSGYDLVILDANTLVEEGRSDVGSDWGVSDPLRSALVYDFDGDGLLEIVAQTATSSSIGNPSWLIWDTGAMDTSGLEGVPVTQPFLGLGDVLPEPTRSGVELRFLLSQPDDVSVRIIDVTGRLVQTVVQQLPLKEGQHSIAWDGRDRDGADVPSGIYFVQLSASGRTDSRKITLVR